MAGLGDKLVLSRTVPISRRILEDAFSSRLMGQSWKKDGEGSKVWGLCASRMQRNRTVSIVRHFSAKISKYTSGKNEAQRSRNIAIIHYRWWDKCDLWKRRQTQQKNLVPSDMTAKAPKRIMFLNSRWCLLKETLGQITRSYSASNPPQHLLNHEHQPTEAARLVMCSGKPMIFLLPDQTYDKNAASENPNWHKIFPPKGHLQSTNFWL